MSLIFPQRLSPAYKYDESRHAARSKIDSGVGSEEEGIGDASISTVDEYFAIISRICKKELDYSCGTKFRSLITGIQQELVCRAGLEEDTTLYTFLRAHKQCSLEFRMMCSFDACPFIDNAKALFFTEKEKNEIINDYRLPRGFRNDSMIINILYHLMKFLEQYCRVDRPLLELAKYYFNKDDNQQALREVDSCELKRQHLPVILFETGNFIELFNEVYKPTNSCKSSSDILCCTRELILHIEKETPQISTVKQYIIALNLVHCDCQIAMTEYSSSVSIDKILELNSDEQFEADELDEKEPLLQLQLVEYIRNLCSLRSFLFEQLKAKNYLGEKQNISIIGLLNEYENLKEREQLSVEEEQSPREPDNENLSMRELISESSHCDAEDERRKEMLSTQNTSVNEELMELKQLCESILAKYDMLGQQENVIIERMRAIDQRVEQLEAKVNYY